MGKNLGVILAVSIPLAVIGIGGWFAAKAIKAAQDGRTDAIDRATTGAATPPPSVDKTAQRLAALAGLTQAIGGTVGQFRAAF
jgi:hypothetical protein